MLFKMAQLSPSFSHCEVSSLIPYDILPCCANCVALDNNRLIVILYSDMNQSEKQVQYRFALQYRTKFGEAVYLAGSVGSLGLWDQHCAVRLENDADNVWSSEVVIPADVEIEYKYFIGPYDRSKGMKAVNWIGEANSKLIITKDMVSNFTQENRKSLRIMSFNLRFENKNDQGDRAWQNRKENCSDLILQVFPDLIGVQQPRTSQRQYLMSKVENYYNYFGKPRNLVDDEQSGIFVRKDKFKVIEDGYIWINQRKEQGKKGFGASLPRYYTYLVVHPFDKANVPFAIFNTHLDHQVEEAKLQGIKYISQTMRNLSAKYSYLRNFFITGDFNTSDDNYIFKHLVHREQRLGSLRYMLPKEKSDYGATFNGFSKVFKFIDKTMKFFNLDPGATIDHIFVSTQDYIPSSFECIRREDKTVSDHYPIVGTFHPS